MNKNCDNYKIACNNINLWEIQFEFNFKLLAENKLHKIGHYYKNCLLFHKQSLTTIELGKFSSAPCCAFLSANGHFVLLGGENVILWTFGKFESIDITWPYEMRKSTKNTIHILTDPWREDSTIWELNLITIRYQKLRPFTKYIGKAHTEKVVW